MRVFEMWKDLLIGMKIKAEPRQKCTRTKGKKGFYKDTVSNKIHYKPLEPSRNIKNYTHTHTHQR